MNKKELLESLKNATEEINKNSKRKKMKSNESFDVDSFIFVKSNPTIELNSSSKANSFYGSIANDRLKQELIQDFIEMELSYLRHEYLEFSRRIEKQIEALVNFIFLTKIRSKLEDDIFNMKAMNKGEVFKLGECVLSPNAWQNANQKKTIDIKYLSLGVKLSIYYFYFINRTTNNGYAYAFNPDFPLMNRITAARITASHGWVELTHEQKQNVQEIEENTTKFYFDCFGLLSKIRFAPGAQQYLQ